MKIENIKPIPKYMLKLIKKIDLEKYKPQNGFTRYYSYLTKNDGELVQVIVAVKNRYSKWLCKQVVVHSMHSKDCFVKDIAYFWIGGYVTNWHPEGYGKEAWYADGKWDIADDRYFHIWCPCINKEYLEKYPQYKYCAYKEYPYGDFFKYLKVYEKYPQAEYIVKMGLPSRAMSIMLLKQCKKDKQFCKWLYKNKYKIKYGGYYITTILTAYKKNLSLDKVQAFEVAKKRLIHEEGLQPVRDMLKQRGDYEKFINYINNQNTSYRTYLDYFNACNYLGIDMNIDKNRYPHEFKRWHDIRINEYASAKAKADAKAKKEFNAKFKIIAKKYESLQENCKGSFICIIAKSPNELVKEGAFLHHCVGKMGYDKKFVDEVSLIFFIRDKNNPKIPLVTVEYSLSKKKILQCYGEHDTKPSNEIENYVYNEWLPYANKKLKKLEKIAA
ncbi:MAG: PcfJ domain-containing protein [Clostridia bacterium]|nr:PcfJ domain-containing protein [Clostridia bacterium]MBQ8768023.1 PcfJ domain-containing protein [Clostridia bacterium]